MLLQDKYRIAVLTAYALALHGLEALLPTPVPWLRVGLANIISLVALMLFGLKTAMFVTLARVTLGSMITGTFLGPSFILSLCGGIMSTAAIGAAYSASKKLFGPVGLSLIGAVFHNVTQLALAWLLFIQQLGPVLLIAPVILLVGTLAGLINGLIADLLMRRLTDERVSES